MAVRRTDTTIGRKERHSAVSRSLSRASDAVSATGEFVWRGASGSLYPHSVTSLIFCPPMQKSTYLLLHRDANGIARVLRVGTLDNEAASLNLAQIRQLGAMLGANEVHVRNDLGAAADRARVVFDIENALLHSNDVVEASMSATPTLV